MHSVLIVGGGIIGLLTAREFALAGVSTTVLERKQPAKESSWAGGGIVSPLFPWRYLDPITELARWSQGRYQSLCAELAENTGIDPEYTASGMITIAPEDADQAPIWADKFDYQLDTINANEFAGLEPAAAQLPDSAVYMPNVAQVRNPRITKSLIAEVQRLGVKIVANTEVTGLNISNNHCHGVTTRNGKHDADNTIVCAGAWTGSVLEDLQPPAVYPVRGQMLLFKTPPGTIQKIVLEGNRYIIPRQDGHVLFGSTIEHVGFAKATTAEAYDELYAIATQRFPVLKQYPVVKHWAGLRPSSPAGMPYISGHPEIASLFVNAGHFRNGVVLAPASARLMCDLVLQHDPILNPAPYSWMAARG